MTLSQASAISRGVELDERPPPPHRTSFPPRSRPSMEPTLPTRFRLGISCRYPSNNGGVVVTGNPGVSFVAVRNGVDNRPPGLKAWRPSSIQIRRCPGKGRRPCVPHVRTSWRGRSNRRKGPILPGLLRSADRGVKSQASQATACSALGTRAGSYRRSFHQDSVKPMRLAVLAPDAGTTSFQTNGISPESYPPRLHVNRRIHVSKILPCAEARRCERDAFNHGCRLLNEVAFPDPQAAVPPLPPSRASCSLLASFPSGRPDRTGPHVVPTTAQPYTRVRFRHRSRGRSV